MADDDEEQTRKKGNSLPLWGNTETMNVNNLIVTNILSSPYFKNDLFKIKTFHEVIDEIYYKVEHLEPWEKGSRKLHGQVGMCGGVRGVGTGGIVSSTYCLLFKLFTLKLSEKQVYSLINHTDSPYIRALGFMFIRYCQHPNTFWDWYEPYLEDDEELDPKAGGGCPMTIGQMVRSFIIKLDWYGTLFPRIPVPVHKELEANLIAYNLNDDRKVYADEEDKHAHKEERKKSGGSGMSFGEAEKYAEKEKKRHQRSSRASPSYSDLEDQTKHRSADRHRHDKEHRSSDRDRTSDRERHSSDKDRHKSHRHRSKERHRRYDTNENGTKSKDRSPSHSHHRSRPKKDRSSERTRHRSRSKDRRK